MGAGAGGAAACKTDPGTFELRSSFGGLGAIQTHAEAFSANRYAVIPKGKIVLINRRPAALAIEIDKRFYAMFRAILIIGHGVVGGIQKKLCDIGLWKELFHGEEVIPKTMGIMSGGRAEQGE